MKKKILIIALATIVLLTTGCFKTDDMDDISIATTNYATYYAINRLYKDNSDIINIYPYGVSKDKYNLTKKQLKDYSKKDLLIYDGNTKDKDDALIMLKYNKNLKIIDSTYGINKTYSSSDVWLNLSDYLMLVQNIKNELQDYIKDPYLSNGLDEKYNLLKIDITSLEASLNQASTNSVNKTIVTVDESMKFLEKYGFTVINLTEDKKEKESNVDIAKNLINENKISYIFVTDINSENKLVESLIKEYNLTKLTFKTLETISEIDLNNNEDFLTIMQSNINLITQETYE